MRFLRLSFVVAIAVMLFSAPLVAGKWGGNRFSSSGKLTEIEIADLQFMREEEKLARDVYITLYEEWGTPIFNNISASEQSHMDAMKRLLEKYNVGDPVADENVLDDFVNEDLGALYVGLIAAGSNSLIDALRVGAKIEEVDIEDIQRAIENTDRTDIKATYESLLCGSGNHLRAFVSQIESRSGEAYEPQWESEYYTPDEWSEMVYSIIDSPMERGCGRR